MRRISLYLAMLVALGCAAGWYLSRPLVEDSIPDYPGDPVAGERLFWAGGCASCHASPVDGDRATGDAKRLLGGGLEMDTAFGVFRVPNISSHKGDGIGAWSALDFVNAMQRGVSPDGRHYYPSFPYTSYARMPVTDVIDLKAFLDTLPSVAGRIADHELTFPYNIRRGIGLWKRRYLSDQPVVQDGTADVAIERGRLLVEGAGHCGECHTARDGLGGLLIDQWLAGAPNLEGEGYVPNITSAAKTVGDWSVNDLVYYLQSGFTPEFDTVGSTMVAIQENMAKLSREDLEAIVVYLKSVPAVESR